MEKTNVMRLLDKANIKYQPRVYDNKLTDGEKIAEVLKEDPYSVFKTLVTRGSDKEYYVFLVQVNFCLNLKNAAKAVNVKSIEMIRQKELLPLTGYIHGGCSPIGMKKKFKTVIDETMILFEKVFVSGGRVGYQIEIDPQDLINYVGAILADIIEIKE